MQQEVSRPISWFLGHFRGQFVTRNQHPPSQLRQRSSSAEGQPADAAVYRHAMTVHILRHIFVYSTFSHGRSSVTQRAPHTTEPATHSCLKKKNAGSDVTIRIIVCSTKVSSYSKTIKFKIALLLNFKRSLLFS